MFNSLNKFGKCICQGARLMVGIPDYETYVNHMKTNHPDQPIMDYKEFFRDRQDVRYGGKGGFRCC
ncbi:MAG: YbdD/YjiX family protein [Commensalibacter sp.]|nr:YbdD/YjiX family protein [Commensalibacter sp.]